MNEKDAIKDLFSNAFERHTSVVRPEVWQGLQSKMAAAGIAASSGAAVKGISALTKWIIGAAAVVGTAAITTVALLNSDKSVSSDNHQAKKDSVENTAQENTQAQADNPAVAQTNRTNNPPSYNVVASPADIVATASPGLPRIDEPTGNLWIPPVSDNSVPKLEDKTTTSGPVTPTLPSGNTNPKTNGTASAIPDNDAGPASAVSVAAITRIPNTFTPNYDGNNDVFFIESENITDFSVLILNAQGQQVFRSTDPDFKWDGTDLNGSPVPNGQYRCVIVASGTDNKPIKRLETVVVAR